MQSENSKKHRFEKGNTFGSGTQRTKGIAAYINSKTNNLQDVVDELLLLYVDKRISVVNRIKIAEYLTAYSVGKPHQTQHIDVEMPVPINFVSVGKSNDETDTSN